MNQEMASTIFYGNSKTDAKKFMGLAARYDHLSTDKTDIGYNVINAGGVGSDNTSIWFGTWGANTMHGIYPKGHKAGLQYKDFGEQDALDENSAPYRALVSLYKWHLGLTLRDWRSCVRIANIDVSELADAGESGFDGANLPNLMIRAYNRQKMRKMGKAVIYCNETIKTALDLLASNKANTYFTIENGVDGNPITKFRGIPIREVESILNTEEAVA